MLGWFACSTLLVSGFALSASVSHFLDWRYQKRDEDSLAFSFVGFAVAGHAIALVFLYGAPTVARYVLALKIDLCFLLVAQAAFVWFVTSHVRAGTRKATLAFAGFFAALFVVNAASANSLVASEVLNLLVQALPGGERYVSAVVTPSPWKLVCLLSTLVTCVYCLVITLRGRRRLDRGEMIVMIISQVCLLVTWLQTTLTGPVGPIMLTQNHYAFLAFVMLMGVALSSRYGRRASSLAETHETLRRSEEQYRALIEKAPDAIVVYDFDADCFVDANPNAALLFGCSREELIGSGLRQMALVSLTEAMPTTTNVRKLGERVLAGEDLTFEQAFRNRNGKEMVCEIRVVRLPSVTRRLVRASLIDISARNVAEANRSEYRQQLRALASELAVTEERERKRIAMYLHDQVAQDLVAARLRLGEFAMNSVTDDTRRSVTQVRDLLEHAVEDTYSLIYDLSLPVLYELGLMPAIEWLGTKICEPSGVHVELMDDHAPKPLDTELRTACYYVIRELLVNVVKHARASNVVIAARVEESSLRLEVRDDGVGFDVAASNDWARTEGRFGMFGVRERLEYLGGAMQVESAPAQGTRVTLCVPLSDILAEVRGSSI